MTFLINSEIKLFLQYCLELLGLFGEVIAVLDVVLLHEVDEQVGVQVREILYKVNVLTVEDPARSYYFLLAHLAKERFEVLSRFYQARKDNMSGEEVDRIWAFLVVKFQLEFI